VNGSHTHMYGSRTPMNGSHTRAAGFTLVEVLVALMVVAIGLSALMVAVSGTARTSGFLRDKTLAQWIATNRLAEVRLNSNNKFATNTDTAEVDFAGRKWHYDTKYFETSIASMKRVIVRVYAGDAKTKGNPLAESTGFLGADLGLPGSSNVDWTIGTTVQTSNGTPTGGAGAGTTITNPTTGTGTSTTVPTTTAPAPTPTTTPNSVTPQ
jgi:general secretion pathway protein I